MRIATILAGALILSTPLAAQAANADHPYANVDHRNDAGNDTGDSQVDRLNQTQLETNGVPARSYPSAGYGYARRQPQSYYPRAYYAPGFYPARPGYVAAPPAYYGY